MGTNMRGTRVYVGNLSDKVKKEDLEGEFTKYGKLNSVWVAFNPPGFAFVEFENRHEAERACDILNGTDILGSKIRVELSKGRPRARRGAPGDRFRNGDRGRAGPSGPGRTRQGGFRSSGGGGGGFRSRGGGGFGGPRSSNGDGGGFRSRGPRSFNQDGAYGSRNGGGYSGSGGAGGRNYGSSSYSGNRSGGGGGGGRFRSRSPAGARRF